MFFGAEPRCIFIFLLLNFLLFSLLKLQSKAVIFNRLYHCFFCCLKFVYWILFCRFEYLSKIFAHICWRVESFKTVNLHIYALSAQILWKFYKDLSLSSRVASLMTLNVVWNYILYFLRNPVDGNADRIFTLPGLLKRFSLETLNTWCNVIKILCPVMSSC